MFDMLERLKEGWKERKKPKEMQEIKQKKTRKTKQIREVKSISLLFTGNPGVEPAVAEFIGPHHHFAKT